MIFRYKVEYEFEAESLFKAQMALNDGKVSDEMAITKSLEAICSEDRIIPKKWVPKQQPSAVISEEVPYATQSGEESEDDQVKLPDDPPF